MAPYPVVSLGGIRKFARSFSLLGMLAARGAPARCGNSFSIDSPAALAYSAPIACPTKSNPGAIMTTSKTTSEKRSGLMRILYATKYSLEGMRVAFATETAFRQEVLIACLSIPLAIALPISFLFKAFLIGATIALLIIELLNTAIESISNLVAQEFHPLVKRAKDMGSAAVMLSLINLSVAWLFALLQFFAVPR